MAFTYSGNPSTNEVDAIRFQTGDTNSKQPILQDEEIQWIISEYPESKRLAVAFRQCANHLAASAVKRKLGPQSEDATERLAYYKGMADKLEKLTSFSGTPPLPSYIGEKVFEKGMMENV